MSTFKQRFEEMLRRLKSHPAVEIYDVVLKPGAEAWKLAQAEEAVGQRLPDAIREFYIAHDGVFLEWGLKGHVYQQKTSPFDFPDYGQPPGCINFVPILQAMSPRWEADYHVNEISKQHQTQLFGQPLDPQPAVFAVTIDNFSKYNHGDLIFGPEPVVVVSTDHGADMDSSDFMSFSTYLDVVLSVFGTNRYSAFGIGWSRQPQRIDAWTQQPTLDEVLAEVENEAQ